jgi:lactoylglutathione lyase
MILVQNLFEAHLTVADLDRSVEFYRDVVGLQSAHVTSTRQAAFFWIGPEGNAMLGLWLGGVGPQRITMHVAFGVSPAEVIAAPDVLRSAGVTPLDFGGQPTDEPVVIAWMPALSIFFRDPDGHLLEYIAMLPDSPRPKDGVVPWHAWRSTDSFRIRLARPDEIARLREIEDEAGTMLYGLGLIETRSMRHSRSTSWSASWGWGRCR